MGELEGTAVVVDANVVLSAAIERGSIYRILKQILIC
jgi:predicted nucleic acid-binding protein